MSTIRLILDIKETIQQLISFAVNHQEEGYNDVHAQLLQKINDTANAALLENSEDFTTVKRLIQETSVLEYDESNNPRISKLYLAIRNINGKTPAENTRTNSPEPSTNSSKKRMMLEESDTAGPSKILSFSSKSCKRSDSQRTDEIDSFINQLIYTPEKRNELVNVEDLSDYLDHLSDLLESEGSSQAKLDELCLAAFNPPSYVEFTSIQTRIVSLVRELSRDEETFTSFLDAALKRDSQNLQSLSFTASIVNLSLSNDDLQKIVKRLLTQKKGIIVQERSKLTILVDYLSRHEKYFPIAKMIAGKIPSNCNQSSDAWFLLIMNVIEYNPELARLLTVNLLSQNNDLLVLAKKQENKIHYLNGRIALATYASKPDYCKSVIDEIPVNANFKNRSPLVDFICEVLKQKIRDNPALLNKQIHEIEQQNSFYGIPQLIKLAIDNPTVSDCLIKKLTSVMDSSLSPIHQDLIFNVVMTLLKFHQNLSVFFVISQCIHHEKLEGQIVEMVVAYVKDNQNNLSPKFLLEVAQKMPVVPQIIANNHDFFVLKKIMSAALAHYGTNPELAHNLFELIPAAYTHYKKKIAIEIRKLHAAKNTEVQLKAIECDLAAFKIDED